MTKEVAIKILRETYDNALFSVRTALATLIPELKENEDERIRKWIIYTLKSLNSSPVQIDGAYEMMLPAIAWLEKQGEQKSKHFELKAGHWYICYRAYCCRADNLTVKKGERFMCEEDGVVKGFVIKEPEKYFKEVCTAPIEIKQKHDRSEEDEEMRKKLLFLMEEENSISSWEGCYEWLKSIMR